MQSYKSSTGLDVFSKRKSLLIRVEHIVVCIGEKNECILLQVLFCKNRRIIRCYYRKSFFLAKLLNGFHSAFNVIVYIAFAIFCVDQDFDIFPFNIAWLGRRGKDNQ